jgi:transcriptional regulator of acetoin/glycerol metabolism
LKKPSLESRLKLLEKVVAQMGKDRANWERERESLFRRMRKLCEDCRVLLTDNKALRLERMGKSLKAADRFMADPLEPKCGGRAQ